MLGYYRFKLIFVCSIITHLHNNLCDKVESPILCV